MENTKKKLIVIGAGSRGKRYTDNALHFPDLYEVAAVAERHLSLRGATRIY